MLKLLCLFGSHDRSRGGAFWEGPKLVSTCRRCGTRMSKQRDGSWAVDHQGRQAQTA